MKYIAISTIYSILVPRQQFRVYYNTILQSFNIIINTVIFHVYPIFDTTKSPDIMLNIDCFHNSRVRRFIRILYIFLRSYTCIIPV